MIFIHPFLTLEAEFGFGFELVFELKLQTHSESRDLNASFENKELSKCCFYLDARLDYDCEKSNLSNSLLNQFLAKLLHFACNRSLNSTRKCGSRSKSFRQVLFYEKTLWKFQRFKDQETFCRFLVGYLYSERTQMNTIILAFVLHLIKILKCVEYNQFE